MATRAQYSDEVKELVRLKYPRCRSVADRQALADELGIESLQKLYNLASRLGATRGHENTADEVVGDDTEIYDPREDMTRKYLRDDPATLIWTRDNDRYLKEAWPCRGGGQKFFIEEIAFQLNRTETAVAYRARQLGLRDVPKYWDARNVAAWLGLSRTELVELTKSRGLVMKPCTDRKEKKKIILVSTISLARVLNHNNFWKWLVKERNADQFFIKDIRESVAAMQLTRDRQFLRALLEKEKVSPTERKRLERLFGEAAVADAYAKAESGKASVIKVMTPQMKTKVKELGDTLKKALPAHPHGGETDWEPSCWVSHGHTCLNPYSEVSFGLFFNGFDKNLIGADLVPEDLHPSMHCASDDWKRGQWMTIRPRKPHEEDDLPARWQRVKTKAELKADEEAKAGRKAVKPVVKVPVEA